MDPSIRFCRSRDGCPVAYATAGEGPPLVQTPTWLTHLRRDWDSPTWRPWLDELSQDHTIVRYDLRGCGLSGREVDDLSLDACVHDLEAVVEALGLEHFPLLGLCQGGVIAAAFAARNPDRVDRLLLYGSYMQGGLARSDDVMADEVESLASLIESGWGRPNPAFRQLFACMLMPEARPDRARALAETERECVTPPTAARLWRAFHRFDVSDQASHIACPTLVAHARDDGMVPFPEGRRLALAIPEARFLALDGRNHILQPEEPAWDRFWDEAHEFFAPSATSTDDKGGASPSPMRRAESTATASTEEFPDLTPREREVLHLIADGHSNNDIAAALDIREKTVRNHITNIFSKLAVDRRAEAIVRARKAGFGRRDA